MKKIVAETLVLSFLACSTTCAVSIEFCHCGYINGVYSVYLDGEGDTFDSIDLTIVPDDRRGELLNPDSGIDGFTPRGPGEEFSFINPLLSAPTAVPGGQGWSLVRNQATSDGIHIAGGPLGSTVETPPSRGLFLANFMTYAGARVRGTVSHAGQVVAELKLNTSQCFPEPTAMSLAVLCLLGFVGGRHR